MWLIIELFVIKRDGRLEKFSPEKIEEAVKKAFVSVDGEENGQCTAVAKEIAVAVTAEMKKSKSVEEIQDIVEAKLMESDRKDVAKAYILYRNERTKVRERNGRLVQKVLDRATSSVDNRSNANVDEKSFSGREKEASADIGKMIALEYGGLSDEVAKAHKEMLIYQHDLEKAVYGVHNCALVNFQELFTYGFHTRNGDVRPPSSFSTACQLMAVAFQCQSQV
nr:MAG TPA: anaerobic ribonucleoside triphosphate reductase [Caudoviricetes sp.]